ncbi:Diadenosine tetraphosphatase ApaH/serine/threonine protein phosphatase, PP2A family [Oryzisolibacter propanilivorax]|uniref:Diadenosine tetraphosphatase ApaH/serine/threonine protein phosphatase, PP2A family n=1 Tax=Oryzisolibacter propanilivorax TaxID=1527607 RepID=A0A1G9S9J7_9BURK|nr:metallophosphoesterase family protein [Oryzisolibacter propanilivorax]SDM32134.1 Diadenosine tetraphosphatase ApaH/serine/threonine protein phosphatase, PP2A family [Oryzisolibacter propanilivorax]
MKMALLSDLHANLPALDACLAHARGQGARQFALLGDLVGYGAEPGPVLQLCMRLVAEEGALAVQGNHDAAALAPPVGAAQNLGEQSAQWTAPRLDESQRAFLAGLPLTARAGPDVLLVHASADGPERWHYVTDGNAAERSMAAATRLDPAIRYVFSGHVHEQALYFLTPTAKLMRFAPQPGVPVPVPPHRQWLALVGSCGQPRDGDTRAMYALFDAGAATLTFHRVAYDHLAAAAAVRASGLPEFFAERLEKGR